MLLKKKSFRNGSLYFLPPETLSDAFKIMKLEWNWNEFDRLSQSGDYVCVNIGLHFILTTLVMAHQVRARDSQAFELIEATHNLRGPTLQIEGN